MHIFLLMRDFCVAFSKETCRIMIAMLDRDRSGKMGFNEFKELWAALNQWKVHKLPLCKG